MTAELLDGERLARAYQDGTRRACGATYRRLDARRDSERSLVGDNPSSARYVQMKIDECKEIGIAILR